MTVFIAKTLSDQKLLVNMISRLHYSLFFSFSKQEKNSQKLTVWNLRRGEENLLHKAN
jgi:hypothetical protein